MAERPDRHRDDDPGDRPGGLSRYYPDDDRCGPARFRGRLAELLRAGLGIGLPPGDHDGGGRLHKVYPRYQPARGRTMPPVGVAMPMKSSPMIFTPPAAFSRWGEIFRVGDKTAGGGKHRCPDLQYCQATAPERNSVPAGGGSGDYSQSQGHRADESRQGGPCL